jgi:Sporulation related domain.
MVKRGLSFLTAIALLVILNPFSLEGQTVLQQGRNQQGLQQQGGVIQEDTSRVVMPRRSIFDILAEQNYGNGSVQVIQSSSIDALMNRYMEKASEKKLQGYRIRVFNSNVQTARSASLDMETKVKEKYPDIAVYRTFAETNFRVSIGDFRTRSDAEKFKREIEKDFPGTFIVRESINFPPL